MSDTDPQNPSPAADLPPFAPPTPPPAASAPSAAPPPPGPPTPTSAPSPAYPSAQPPYSGQSPYGNQTPYSGQQGYPPPQQPYASQQPYAGQQGYRPPQQPYAGQQPYPGQPGGYPAQSGYQSTPYGQPTPYGQTGSYGSGAPAYQAPGGARPLAPSKVSPILLLVTSALGVLLSGLVGPPSLIMSIIALMRGSTDPAKAARTTKLGWIVLAVNAVVGIPLIILLIIWLRR